MSHIVVLDSGVVGLLTHPRGSPESQRCKRWFTTLTNAGFVFMLPEIADYEIRREAIRTGQTRVIQRLDLMKTTTRYEPITTAAMLEAARLWALVRNQGRPTADRHALDGDVILAGQVAQLAPVADSIVIATTNVRHLALFGQARPWQDITLPA